LPIVFPQFLAFFSAAIFLLGMPCGYGKQSVTIFTSSPFHKDPLSSKSYRSLPETVYLFKWLKENDCSGEAVQAALQVG
jgi:hypothetical protein